MDEAELLVGFIAGEPDRVAEVYRSYGRLVYAVAYRVLGDADLAEDAARQTFVQAWKLASGGDADHGIEQWLATIAGRTAIDIRRNRRRSARAAQTPTGPEPGGTIPSAEQLLDVWLVRRALDSLPDQDRELIRLQHRRLTQTEIADRLAIPLASVKSRSSQAHRRLTQLLRNPSAATSPSG